MLNVKYIESYKEIICNNDLSQEENLTYILTHPDIVIEKKQELIKLCLNAMIDWELVIKCMVEQGVHFDFLAIVQDIQVDIPLKVLRKLELYSNITKQKKKEQLIEYINLQELFTGQGIEPVVLKGFCYEYHGYLQNELRFSKDIDILVPLESYFLVEKILEEHDYKKIVNIDNPHSEIRCSLKGTYEPNSIYLSESRGFCEFINYEKNIKVEVYTTLPYFGNVPMKRMYANRISDGLYYLDCVDTFIFTCAVFWEHYRGKMNMSSLKLRSFWDIRKGYLLLKRMGLLESLFERIKTYGMVEFIRIILTIVYKVCGCEFDNRMIDHCNEKYVFKNQFYEIDIFKIDYVLNPVLLEKKYIDIYLRNSDKFVFDIMCMYRDEPDLELRYVFGCEEIDKNLFYTSHIYSKFGCIFENIYIKYAFAWCKNGLRMKLFFRGNHSYSLHDNLLNLASSYIKIDFGIACEVGVFYIQPKERGGVYIRDTDTNCIEMLETESTFDVHKEWFCVNILLDWNNIGLYPRIGERIGFDITGFFFDNIDLARQVVINLSKGNGIESYNFNLGSRSLVLCDE